MQSGDINYLSFKQLNETVLTIIQPLTTFDGKTNVGGKISIFSGSGEFQADKSKAAKYGEPIVLFNPNNKAGLKLVESLSEAKNVLPEALKQNADVIIDPNKIAEANAITVEKLNRISIGSGTMLEVGEDNGISLIKTPKLSEKEKGVLESLLKFTVRAVIGKEQTYRANIMLLDPHDNLMKIAASYNMDEYEDKNISLKSGTGGAGKALRTSDIVKFDINYETHLSTGVNPDEVWPELRSIFSIPVKDSSGSRLAVLSIDSDRNGKDTKWYGNTEFDNIMRLAADSFGKFLETKT